jgi:hypothetical protein
VAPLDGRIAAEETVDDEVDEEVDDDTTPSLVTT